MLPLKSVHKVRRVHNFSPRRVGPAFLTALEISAHDLLVVGGHGVEELALPGFPCAGVGDFFVSKLLCLELELFGVLRFRDSELLGVRGELFGVLRFRDSELLGVRGEELLLLLEGFGLLCAELLGVLAGGRTGLEDVFVR